MTSAGPRALVRNRAKASRQRDLPLLRYQRTYTTPSFGRITHPPIYYRHITRQRIMSPHNVITKTTGSTGNRPYSIPLAEGRFDEDASRRSPEGCARDWSCCSPVLFDRSVVRVPMGSGRSVRARRCPPERSAECGGGYVDRYGQQNRLPRACSVLLDEIRFGTEEKRPAVRAAERAREHAGF